MQQQMSANGMDISDAGFMAKVLIY